ncbi:hypothetical protein DFH07DRAFT_811470 [Mycena maculata]|uniref:Uncharacterized protein n=1 Tax=Mycena maculata TaxID=230809 RepID=A0AAD7JID5_9AGAR|nr:hypothetical protein DFH07DRAFT_811470 [Mycena maculata]
MISFTLISLALLSFANAETALVDIEAIEAHLTHALIVPSLLPTFTPGGSGRLARFFPRYSPARTHPRAKHWHKQMAPLNPSSLST